MYRVIFSIGPFTLYSYGLFVAIAFVVATYLIVRQAERSGISQDGAFDCVIAMLAGGLIGGRVLFAIINWEYFSGDFISIFKFYEGGLAFQGGLAGGTIAVLLVIWIKKLPGWEMCDLLAPYVALGQAIGRIGCLLNGCCYGKVISSGFGITFPQEAVTRVPVQVYSSLILLAIFALLVSIREKKPFSGAIFSAYLMLYGITRFFIDFARGDRLVEFLGMKLSQVFSIGIFLSGIIIYAILSQINKRKTG